MIDDGVAFRLDDLSDVATHTAPASPLAVAAGPDGTVAGGAQNASADVPDRGTASRPSPRSRWNLPKVSFSNI
ncbi:hypothetical protein [Streptomyces pseudogriseolus]|jgi:hypothetical protein|uniref:hypothetical protein n=1 Tax=Streptomyces pseudogriseolus TaxID=36817 RepID=UPI003FA31AC2